jgi:catechol 2,3-dioxygenase-like lactoylglutathione lyase family enzyme
VLGQHLGRTAPGSPAKLQQLGIDHIGFYVNDVVAVVDRAHSIGAQVIVGPKENDGPAYGYDGEASIRTALFYDPDGTIIQVDQWL